MTLSEHLAELRSRLIRAVLAVAVGFFVAYSFHEELFEVMARPVLKAMRNHGIPALQALQVTEAITVYLQVSLVAALIGTAPYLFYQAWAFVAPGLYARERKLVRLVAGLVSGFFLLGVLFCHAVFLPLVADYLIGFTQESGSIRLLPTVEKTFGLVTLFPLVFGVVFQLPLVMFLLSLLGIFDHKRLLRASRYFVVFAFIIGAIFTPPDPLSQVLMAVPITFLFFVGVVFAWVGGLLREGGMRTVARVVAGGVVFVFAALVVVAAVWWNLPAREPDPADFVGDGAWFAIRADPASRVGRAAIETLGVSPFWEAAPRWVLVTGDDRGRRVWTWGPDASCDGTASTDGVCPVGATALDPPSTHTVTLGQGPVGAFIRPRCMAQLAPEDGMGSATLQVDVIEDAGGLVRMTWTLLGETGSWRAWAERLRDEWPPGGVPPGLDRTALGRAMAWSAGDLEVSDAADPAVITLTLTPGRAARSVTEIAAGLRRCRAGGE